MQNNREIKINNSKCSLDMNSFPKQIVILFVLPHVTILKKEKINLERYLTVRKTT